MLLLLCSVLVLAGCVGGKPPQVISLRKLDPAAADPVIPAEGQNAGLRIGSAALISPVETMRSYSALYNYIGQKVGLTPEVYQRRTYAETNELVRSGGVDMALVCSYAYVLGKQEFSMEAIAVPVVRGKAEYYSYIIVRSDSGIRSFDDLRGRAFAFTDPISTSGRLYAEGLLVDRNTTVQEFFRQTTFTFSHDNSIKAVAEGVVDGAAVDSLVYEQKVKQDPDLGRKLKIIERSLPFGAPPIVVNPKLEPELKRKLQATLLTMHATPEGQRVLADLDIERFVPADDHWYDSVRALAQKVRTR
jgi:phosphonate transport system substrate-binding protein